MRVRVRVRVCVASVPAMCVSVWVSMFRCVRSYASWFPGQLEGKKCARRGVGFIRKIVRCCREKKRSKQRSECAISLRMLCVMCDFVMCGCEARCSTRAAGSTTTPSPPLTSSTYSLPTHPNFDPNLPSHKALKSFCLWLAVISLSLSLSLSLCVCVCVCVCFGGGLQCQVRPMDPADEPLGTSESEPEAAVELERTF